MKTQTYTKINTLHKRFMNLGKVELPKKEWLKFQNKIMINEFTDPAIEFCKDLKYDCFSKIDGTNSKIVYFPSTGECFCGGKTDSADIVGTGQKAYLDAVIARIKPILAEMFPKESAKFTPVLNDKQQIAYSEFGYTNENDEPLYFPAEPNAPGNYMVELEEVPVYIYGEFYGKKIQKGGNYDKEKNRFSVFDICQQGWYVPINILRDYCERLGLEMVPYLGQMTIPEAEHMVIPGFKTRVVGAANPDYIEEGIVARPVIPIKDTRGKRMIVKIKHEDYRDLNRVIDEVGVESYHEFYKWYLENQEMIENISKQ